MKRVFAVVLMCLLLTGCTNSDIIFSQNYVGQSISISVHNGYVFTEHDIQQNDNGSYTITVTAEKGEVE